MRFFRSTGLRQLAAVVAIIVNLLTIILLSAFSLIHNIYSSTLLIVLCLSIGISYFFVHFIIVGLVYNRIKPLYKVIRTVKSVSKVESQVDMTNHMLERVEQDVDKWVHETKKEMETLKSLENYRREYIGNVSHELKTPIFNIQGFVHTLLDGAMYDKKYLKTYVKRTASNTERLITIVEDLDTINRIESGALSLEFENFNLEVLVLDVIDELKEMAESKQITIEMKDGHNKAFTTKADKRSIRQVLSNLISNSIKYGKEGGTTRIGFYEMDHTIVVEVSDDGIGIEERHLKHVFDRFYRIEKSRSRVRDAVGGGSGLGLAIAKHLIEAHGQTITVRSTPDHGSTFVFTLEKP